MAHVIDADLGLKAFGRYAPRHSRTTFNSPDPLALIVMTKRRLSNCDSGHFLLDNPESPVQFPMTEVHQNQTLNMLFLLKVSLPSNPSSRSIARTLDIPRPILVLDR